MSSNMYPNTKTWNPFVGCRFDCVYCEPSFKRQLKRVAFKIKCTKCFDYVPHLHHPRMRRIPSAPIVFVCGTGDITFCPSWYVRTIFKAIDKHRPRKEKTYYFQSKNPIVFNKYLDWFNENQDKVILLTTLETNRDEGYEKISKAPPPSKRFKDFYELDYPRKVVTIEPVLDFDPSGFADWFLDFVEQESLEYVWFGFDSKKCSLPEPTINKAQRFVTFLIDYCDIEVRGKSLREVKI